MNHFESVEQIQADLDMQGEYFNAFACKQLMKYFDRRKNKLPIEPVIPFDKESYLNQRGGKYIMIQESSFFYRCMKVRRLLRYYRLEWIRNYSNSNNSKRWKI